MSQTINKYRKCSADVPKKQMGFLIYSIKQHGKQREKRIRPITTRRDEAEITM